MTRRPDLFAYLISMVLCLMCIAVSGAPRKKKLPKPDLSVRKATVHHKGVRRQELTLEVKGDGEFEVIAIHLYKLTDATSGVYELDKKVLGKFKLKNKTWRKVIHTDYKHGNRRLYDSLVILKGNNHFLKWGTSPVFLDQAQTLSGMASGIRVDSKGKKVSDYQDKKEYQKDLLGKMGKKQITKLKREKLKNEVADHNRVTLDLSGDGLRAAPGTIKIDGWPLRARASAEKLIGNTLDSSDKSIITMTVLVYSRPEYTSFPKAIDCTGVFALYGDKIWRTKTFKTSYPADRPGCMLLTLKDVPDWGNNKTIDVILRLRGKDQQEYLLKDVKVALEESL